MRRLFFSLFFVVGLMGLTYVEADMVTAPSGLKYDDSKVGTGSLATAGKTVTVNYTGWLNEGGKKGTKFDSSFEHGEPFQVLLGVGRVIRGWDEGIPGMKVGGKRTLYIPSAMAYGDRGAGSLIPPNADLIFDVELLNVQ